MFGETSVTVVDSEGEWNWAFSRFSGTEDPITITLRKKNQKLTQAVNADAQTGLPCGVGRSHAFADLIQHHGALMLFETRAKLMDTPRANTARGGLGTLRLSRARYAAARVSRKQTVFAELSIASNHYTVKEFSHRQSNL